MPPKSIVMMEDHDKAYHAWKERVVRARTLVHVDAHIDFGWIPEMDIEEIGMDGRGLDNSSHQAPLLNPFIKSRKKMLNIGNYICPAIRDGMVEKFFWVVPDESWNSRRGLRYIAKFLKRLLKIERFCGRKLELHKDYARCRILGKEVVVCSLENLKRIDEPVLLDIDVDFMLTKFIWDDLNPKRTPWIFPEELFAKIAPKIKDIDILTIAYSVEGGFTPLKFKDLGDQLRDLFEEARSEEKRNIARLKKDALLKEREKKHKEAIGLYEAALKIDSRDASLYFNLCLLHLNGPAPDINRARNLYREALAMDKTYATIFNNSGILYLRQRRLKDAEEEFRKFMQLDGENAAVFNGLGHVALKKKEYNEAKDFFTRCLSINESYPEARLGRAVAHFKTGNLKEAKEIFLGLAKSQEKDPEVFWWLGLIAEKSSQVPEAIGYYKNSVMLGGEGAFVHLRLMRLYLRKGFYFRAYEEFKRALHDFKTFFCVWLT